MLLKLSFATALLAGFYEIASAAAVGNHKRQTTTDDFQLYAYGKNISGLPIFYGDGTAYIGTAIPQDVTESVNITFTYSTSDSTTWPISPNSTTTWGTSPVLYINPSSGSFDSVGFVNTTDSLPDGAVTNGFFFYGQSAMYQSSSGAMEAKFWATPTAQEGVWTLKWNADGTSQGDSVPVVVKDTPPVTISKMMG